MKKLYTIILLVSAGIIFQSSVKKNNFSFQPPEGYTGASGDYCANCHSSFGLNSGGGSVTTTGLPTGSFTAGQTYTFSLTIAHGAADRKRWGFSIKAVNNAGNDIGTFSSSNANANNNGSELSHQNAVITASQPSYTYTNLKWTAPATPGPDDAQVTFYYVGNAANQAGGNTGDYIYAGTKLVALPLTLGKFDATSSNNVVSLNWSTLTEINTNYFDIEKSDNNQIFYAIGKVQASGNTTVAKVYAYKDHSTSYYNKPVYYRLKMVDRDGTMSYSKTVSVKLNAKENFIEKVYPTIVAKGTTVNADITSVDKQTINIKLVDALGRELQNETQVIAKGSSTVNFRVSAPLSKGTAFVVFVGENFKQTIPLIVP